MEWFSQVGCFTAALALASLYIFGITFPYHMFSAFQLPCEQLQNQNCGERSWKELIETMDAVKHALATPRLHYYNGNGSEAMATAECCSWYAGGLEPTNCIMWLPFWGICTGYLQSPRPNSKCWYLLSSKALNDLGPAYPIPSFICTLLCRRRPSQCFTCRVGSI